MLTNVETNQSNESKIASDLLYEKKMPVNFNRMKQSRKVNPNGILITCNEFFLKMVNSK